MKRIYLGRKMGITTYEVDKIPKEHRRFAIKQYEGKHFTRYSVGSIDYVIRKKR